MDNKLLNKYFDILNIKNMPSFMKKYLEVPSLIRLKDIGYFCGMDYASKDIYDFKIKISRYDHSLSVALLTWMYTADKLATLAGLFHDVATPCFAHVIDYMNKDYEVQESTEEYTKEMLEKDDILLSLLKEDNINIDDISDFKRYSIVDNDRPKLCADRLDGIILTGLAWTKSLNILDIEKIINSIEVYKNEDNSKELGFNDKDIAKETLYTSDLIDLYCHTKEDNYMMELLAKITKKAINDKIINYEDLYILTENNLIKILKNSNNDKINELIDKFQNIKKEEIPDFDLVGVKSRKLNPLVKGIRYK